MGDAPEQEERPEAPPESRSGEAPAGAAEPMGALGQPASEPAPRGTFVLLLLFLLLLIASWVFVYLQVWDRGIS